MSFPVPPVPHYQNLIAALSQQMAQQQGQGQQRRNPYMIQPADRIQPMPLGVHNDWNFDAPYYDTPNIVTPGYAAPRNGEQPTVVEPVDQVTQAQPVQGGFTPAPGNIAPGLVGHGAPDDPQSVFGQMRKSLPAATRSNLHSHRAALVARFMQNARGVKAQ